MSEPHNSSQLVIKTTKCQESGRRVSTLISGRIEDLSFLSSLIRAHAGDLDESLRETVELPDVHKDLRERWYPEVLYDIELQRRILAASLPKSIKGFSSFVMVPLVEMHLDRTKVITEKSTNGVSMVFSTYGIQFD